MKLVVGLGNPGKEYDGTRHNIGYYILDNYLNNVLWQEKFDGLFFCKNYELDKVLFFKPLTYMNNSGSAVFKITNYYKINPDDILVIHDDLDLKFGTYKIKFDSSSGGHNGVKSIIKELNTQKFWRLKIGISNNKQNVREYVLGKFKIEEKESLKNQIVKYNNIIDCFIKYGGDKTMTFFNKKRN